VIDLGEKGRFVEDEGDDIFIVGGVSSFESHSFLI
jgi:hypothetical protein